jgi:hypothetical protein
MTFKLSDKDNDYILGIWFSQSKGFGNTMVIMKKGENDTSWEGQVRNRYYTGDSRDPFDGKDTKSFFVVKFKDATESEMIEKIELFLKSLCESQLNTLDNPFVHDRVIVQGNMDVMMEKVKDKDWFHMKEAE